jgi:hypothetical protein
MDNAENIYPLTPSQKGILFEFLSRPDRSTYFHQLRCILTGSLDAASFIRAWETVLSRHQALRSSFLWEDLAEPVQVIHSNG